MSSDREETRERASLLGGSSYPWQYGANYTTNPNPDLSVPLSEAEQALGDTTVGERLPYNDYATIDWLHELARESLRARNVNSKPGLRYRLMAYLDAADGWIAAASIGLIAAVVAFCIDVTEAMVSDWKFGYCTTNIFSSRRSCCPTKVPGVETAFAYNPSLESTCAAWQPWTDTYWQAFGVYTAFALAFSLISVSITLTTKSHMPAPHREPGDTLTSSSEGKLIYLAAGSGIPEIKTILAGFVIPNILGLRVLVVKAVGAVFAVGSGLCLGKEGPLVHIGTSIAYLVSQWFPKYRDNGRKLRQMLSVGCAAGIAVAFGAPIGGVLFSYEEISTFFPRRVLWRAFLCSLAAAVSLKTLNPSGDGKLAFFETNYGVLYLPSHYVMFVILGVAGGVYGGIFCKFNFRWSGWFRTFPLMKQHPALEVAMVVLVTSLVQYPNPIAREPGDHVIKELLRDCKEDTDVWICAHEASADRSKYIGWLFYGMAEKLVLTTITFGCKVPSGVIIPALDGGAFFGRLLGQAIPTISPGIFAMVGAAAFLAGVSRMTISLCVVMFEATGELEYIVPTMIAILVAKWVADAVEPNGVYDLAQTVLGHPFLDGEHAMGLAQRSNKTAAVLIPPPQTVDETSVEIQPNGLVPRSLLIHKLTLLKRRGLIDGGLVLVQNREIKGYIVENELEFGLHESGAEQYSEVRLLGRSMDAYELDLSQYVDRCPITLSETAPIEYAVEMFTKLGLRYLCLVEEGSNKLVGMVIKKRLIAWVESLHE